MHFLLMASHRLDWLPTSAKTEVAQYLLDHDADPNSPSRNQQRVASLHSAASSNSVRIASALIEKRAKINGKQ
jgi:ankyrin repeat protein